MQKTSQSDTHKGLTRTAHSFKTTPAVRVPHLPASLEAALATPAQCAPAQGWDDGDVPPGADLSVHKECHISCSQGGRHYC